MEQITDLAIVLRSVPFDERHRVITFLTQSHGRLSAVARNSVSSRRFGGSLDPFVASQLRWVEKAGSDLGRIEEALVKRDYVGLRSCFEKLTVASFFNELLLKVAPEKEHNPHLFKIHANSLATLEELPLQSLEFQTDRVDLFLAGGYLIKLLQWGGHQPPLQGCVSCEKPRSDFSSDSQVSVQFETGAWICADCKEPSKPIPLLAIDMAFLFLSQSYRATAQLGTHAQLSRHFFEYSFGLACYHIPGFDPKYLKSLQFLYTP